MRQEQKKRILEEVVLKTENIDSMHFRLISAFSPKAQKNIASCFGKYCPENEMIAFLDTTVFDNGKKGYLLGLNGMYSDQFSRIKKVERIIFDEMVSVEKRGKFDLDITTKNGESYPVCTLIHTKYFLAFLQTLLDEMNKAEADVETETKAEEKKPQKNTGRKYIEADKFETVYRRFKQKEITAVQAAEELNISKTTFYRRVKEREN